jgi:hypothetical protein
LDWRKENIEQRKNGRGKDMSGGTRYGGELRKERRDLSGGKRYGGEIRKE